MSEPVRVSVEEAFGKIRSGSALLVCAYEDEEKFKMYRLQGAVSLGEFRSKLSVLSKDQEIIFYCH
jgi:hypothetical protein